jgi:two-component system sensor histidine kinase BaeS
MADPALTAQVMSNLMTNAINYTPRGGVVTITTAVRFKDDREWVTFTVLDTGLGISPGEMPRVFDRFFRGKAGLGSGIPGTGLGLSICKEIVDRLGGTITVESELERGAAFTVWLRSV